MTMTDPATRKPAASSGSYLTVWKKQPDGGVEGGRRFRDAWGGSYAIERGGWAMAWCRSLLLE